MTAITMPTEVIQARDMAVVHRVVPHQLAVEIMRSGSAALISDVMRALTTARQADELSESCYLGMILAFADVLYPRGAVQ